MRVPDNNLSTVRAIADLLYLCSIDLRCYQGVRQCASTALWRAVSQGGKMASLNSAVTEHLRQSDDPVDWSSAHE